MTHALGAWLVVLAVAGYALVPAFAADHAAEHAKQHAEPSHDGCGDHGEPHPELPAPSHGDASDCAECWMLASVAASGELVVATPLIGVIEVRGPPATPVEVVLPAVRLTAGAPRAPPVWS